MNTIPHVDLKMSRQPDSPKSFALRSICLTSNPRELLHNKHDWSLAQALKSQFNQGVSCTLGQGRPASLPC